jgi:hypothetical protein
MRKTHSSRALPSARTELGALLRNTLIASWAPAGILLDDGLECRQPRRLLDNVCSSLGKSAFQWKNRLRTCSVPTLGAEGSKEDKPTSHSLVRRLR